MKIVFEDIAKYKIEVIEYLNDSIMKFKIEMPDIYDDRWELYLEQLNKENSSTKKFIDNEIVGRYYDKIGTRDEIVKINFRHCFQANYYYSNGQKIISVVESQNGYEIGIHKSNKHFTDFFYPHSSFAVLSLENCKVQTYETKEKLESEIVSKLSFLEVQRIALEHDSNIDYMEVQKVHLSDYILRYGHNQKQLNLKYEGPTFDTEFKEFLKSIEPRKAICCIECKHFQFSGMSHSMSGGHSGYCQLMRSKLKEPNVKQSITNITLSCSNFERKDD